CFFQAEDGIRDATVTGVQTCALPICGALCLLGITGSGKTFTVASVIDRTQRPTLVIAHNKTLAAQLYQEFKTLFPENAVEYFVRSEERRVGKECRSRGRQHRNTTDKK